MMDQDMSFVEVGIRTITDGIYFQTGDIIKVIK